MKLGTFMISASLFAMSAACQAQAAEAPAGADGAVNAGGSPEDHMPEQAKPKQVFGTGVAKGRDLLDLAISASSLRDDAIEHLAARSLAETFHNIPGVRAEVAVGEGNSNITVRGLPMASTGAKFLQIQENGLPVVEFGDMIEEGADQFMRFDLNVAQIEAIRGGSSSTFASNSPGGVINLIDKTGEVEGGSIMASTGLGYDTKRVDADYGGKIGNGLRFHVGGFYRQGEGPRSAGFDAFKGGQIKLNVTKTFDQGYVRIYGKYLNDRVPFYETGPVQVSGSDANPVYSNVPNFDINRDTLMSRSNISNLTVDENNNPVSRDIRKGQHSIVKSVGLEAKIEVSGWTITERFRYSNIGGTFFDLFPIAIDPAASVAESVAGPGATLQYARGPLAGQAISNPSALNGNGLATLFVTADNRLRNFDNITNDLRASRVWHVGNGDLTTTAGFYASRQTTSAFKTYNLLTLDVVGGGNAAPLNILAADGTPFSQDGYLSFGAAAIGLPNIAYDVDYSTRAAFGSLNYMVGKFSIGASLRYDYGGAKGRISGTVVSGGTGTAAIDMDRDGTISSVEQNVAILPAGSSPVDYSFNYLSYSTGANYRLAESLAIFARYSRGARANSDRLLGSAAIDPQTGGLLDREAVIDYVKQLEGGMKYRGQNLTVNVTAFLANTTEHNFYFGPKIDRKYRTYGVEFEAVYRAGAFNFSTGVTYTAAKIVADATDSSVVGNKPIGQPALFGFFTPAVIKKTWSIGTNVYGLTGRYTSDINQLRLPGYVLINPFVQFRPVDRLQLSVNANNVFNAKGVSQAPINPVLPANGLAAVQAITGRTVLASLRYDF